MDEINKVYVKVKGKTYELGGTDVEANTQETPTEDLENIRIGDKVYGLPDDSTINSISINGTPIQPDENKNVDLPAYPTVNDGKLTIKKNNTKLDDFTANQSGNTEINIEVPTALSELEEDTTHRTVTDTEKSTWNDKQNAIDSSHKLDSDLVDDTNQTHKFATSEQLTQIGTNQQDIAGIKDGQTLDSFADVEAAIQNVTEIAEGKTATYVIDDTTTGTNVLNTSFNSSNTTIVLDLKNGNAYNKITDVNGNDIRLANMKVGDIIAITQTDVPDRWVGSITSTQITFYHLEIKLTIDQSVVQNSTNPVSGGAVYDYAVPATNIGYVELNTSNASSNVFTLTDVQLAEMNKKYCIVKLHDDIDYVLYKSYISDGGLAILFNMVPRIQTGSYQIVEYDYTLTVNTVAKTGTYSLNTWRTYDKDYLDSKFTATVGYISTTISSSGTLTTEQLNEAKKDYCILNSTTYGTFYKYRDISSETTLKFRTLRPIESALNGRIGYYNTEIIVNRTSGAYNCSSISFEWLDSSTGVSTSDEYIYSIDNIANPIPSTTFNLLIAAKISIVVYQNVAYSLISVDDHTTYNTYIFASAAINNGVQKIIEIPDSTYLPSLVNRTIAQPLIDSTHKLDADLVDDTNSTNKFVTASDKTNWNSKQDGLVSGTNIKTINNESILGSGNIDIQGGGGYNKITIKSTDLKLFYFDYCVINNDANAISNYDDILGDQYIPAFCYIRVKANVIDTNSHNLTCTTLAEANDYPNKTYYNMRPSSLTPSQYDNNIFMGTLSNLIDTDGTPFNDYYTIIDDVVQIGNSGLYRHFIHFTFSNQFYTDTENETDICTIYYN